MSRGNRIYDLAHKLDVPSRELLTFLKARGVEVKSHMSSIDDKTAESLMGHFSKKEKAPSEKTSPAAAAPEKKAGSRSFIPSRRRSKRRHEVSKKLVVEKVRAAETRAAATAKQTLSEGPTEAKPAAPSSVKATEKRRSASAVKTLGDGSPAETKKAAREAQRPTAGRKRKPDQTLRATVQRRRPPAQEKTRSDERPTRRPGQGQKSAQPEKASQAKEQLERNGRVKQRTADDAGRRRDTRQYVYRSDESGAFTGKSAGSPDKKKADEKPRRRKVPAGKRQVQAAENDLAGSRSGAKKKAASSRKAGDSVFQRSKPRPKPGRRQKKKPVKPSAAHTAETAVKASVVAELPKVLEIPEVIMVKELAAKMNMPPARIIQHLMTMGFMPNVNQVLEPEAAKSIAEHFEFEVKTVSVEEEAEFKEEVVDESRLKHRPPVVTIMGHVDHGKTTLLDAIRESKITESEFGGITQHIGAYAVEVNGEKIVFLDTPGHEAFTAMRARGAKVTDEVVLVVAADDGIMPQTIEAIDHARDAGVPIIIAINKIDTPGANPDRVMQELTKYGLTPEDWGGETICVRVSAKEKTNLDDLLEMILLQAEMLELKADPDRAARGVIVEALLDKGRGPVATVLVQGGTLRVGDPFVVGQFYGKVRAMLDDRGKKVEDAGPATPVEVLGLSGVPTAGDLFTVVGSDREARQVSASRQEQQQKLEFSKTAKITLEGLHQKIKEGETQELRIVIKADVHGSVEALKDALERLSTEQVRLQAIHGGVGAINESDVMLASASNAIVLGFNVRPVAKAQEMAEKEQIDVRLYTVIYHAIDDVKKAMEGLLEPKYNEVLVGQAQVQAIFNLPKGGKVAGCRVTDGKIQRHAVVRLLRDRQELFKGSLASLRRVKDDVKEVMTGYECGIRLENYNDVREGDIIEAYTLEKITMTLEEAAAQKH
ncbi:translation initiation factor IF-2 [candidate division KSB3 bacterium]|uniref:Translation initiation factor IF-2 n=1 Tax=candidate division KSB3 bacterium TaxID=2044937 RepID=A0A2G6E1I9_9BACT|nr:MAG: translation initiation factor IF-2 [candidate division KSB3 bacterium]PIE28574.1 MAG: translation initiation factor IF-2 [candidate division KSB3 bacterium]